MNKETLAKANEISEIIITLESALNNLQRVELVKDDSGEIEKRYLVGWLGNEQQHLSVMITDYIEKLRKEFEEL